MSATQRGFDPSRSKVSSDTLGEFLTAPLDSELLNVPGVGPATKSILEAHEINTSWQLLSCYLRVCDRDMTSKERVDAFWFFLEGLGVPGGTRSTIVKALAEKANIMIPGIYDTEEL